MLRTKIICTLGPASTSPDAILELVQGGMNLARLNMSHGVREDHRAAIGFIRDAAAQVGQPVGIMVDLSGPKIRVGELGASIELKKGKAVVVAPYDKVQPGEIPCSYRSLSRELQPGDTLLLDDGLLELRCVGTEGDRTELEVVRGGLLKARKGINLPGVTLTAPSLTEKDLSDLEFALEEGVEYVALSFVRGPEDVIDIKKRVGDQALVIAKIEKAEALRAIEEILPETDAVMVARGDLGVELPFERVPLAQKRIVEMANLYARPVITATQMLESMLEHPRPTRAEASDVANAILDGTDALMLSGETAVGRYPREALEALVNIGTEIERSGFLVRGPQYLTHPSMDSRGGASSQEHAVSAATVDAVRRVNAPAIVVITRSGFSARLVSSYRPSVPVFAVTTDRATYRQLSMVWGVQPVLAENIEVSYNSLTAFGLESVLSSGVGEAGTVIPVTAGYPFHQSGSTNTMRLEHL